MLFIHVYKMLQHSNSSVDHHHSAQSYWQQFDCWLCENFKPQPQLRTSWILTRPIVPCVAADVSPHLSDLSESTFRCNFPHSGFVQMSTIRILGNPCSHPTNSIPQRQVGMWVEKWAKEWAQVRVQVRVQAWAQAWVLA